MTAVDVCNNALGQIAHDRTITSLSDGSAEAVRCALFLPRARRAVLAARPWKFLQASAAPGAGGTPLSGFTKAYARPSTALLVTGALDSGGAQLPFLDRGGLVHTKGTATVVLYTADDETPDNWPPLVQDAVIAELADRLARTMAASRTVIEACAQGAQAALARAALEDDRQTGVTQDGSTEVLDLCNNALAAAGSERDLVSLADGSREAALCNRLYPLARRALLASRPWTWAQASAAASVAGGVTPDTGYTAAYTVPTGALVVTAALSSAGVQLPFAVRGSAVHVDGTATAIRYTADMTAPTAWPAAFTDLVIAGLALRLARAMPALAPRAEGLAAAAADAFAMASASEDAAAGVTQDGSDEVLDLCNAALALAGSERDIGSLGDGSREASLCNRLYPLTRRALLASRPWAWAQAEGAVSVAAGVTPSAPYTAAYTVPAGALAVTAALSSTGVQLPYAVRGAAVHVDGTATKLRYTADMTDPTAWPAAFKDALISHLAARLATAIPALAPRAGGLAEAAAAALAGAEAAEDRAAGVTQDGADEVLDICNAALALAGSERDVGSLGDGSREASLCNRLYPLTRRALLAARPWTFAAAEDDAETAVGVTADDEFDGAYEIPDGSLKVNGVTDDTGARLVFAVRRGAVHVAGTASRIGFTSDVTDPSLWPALFKDALISGLAARLATAIPALAQRAGGLSEAAAAAFAQAADADQRMPTTQDGEAEVLDICNCALADAGSAKDVSSLADGSREAALCARLYPRAVASVLAGGGPWGFARRVDAAAPLDAAEPLPGYETVVAAPGGQVLVVRDEVGDPLAWELADGLLHVRGGAAALVEWEEYVDDPAEWPVLFRDAVTAELAARLARALPGGSAAAAGRAAVSADDALARARRRDMPPREAGERNPYAEARNA